MKLKMVRDSGKINFLFLLGICVILLIGRNFNAGKNY